MEGSSGGATGESTRALDYGPVGVPV